MSRPQGVVGVSTVVVQKLPKICTDPNQEEGGKLLQPLILRILCSYVIAPSKFFCDTTISFRNSFLCKVQSQRGTQGGGNEALCHELDFLLDRGRWRKLKG
jgi:hypothetical protein